MKPLPAFLTLALLPGCGSGGGHTPVAHADTDTEAKTEGRLSDLESRLDRLELLLGQFEIQLNGLLDNQIQMDGDLNTFRQVQDRYRQAIPLHADDPFSGPWCVEEVKQCPSE